MIRTYFGGLIAAVVLTQAAPALAQTPQFHWQTGQVLTYKVEHVTAVTEVVGDSQIDAGSKLNQLKSWHVTDVDARGTATLELSLKQLRFEVKSPDGKVLLFDSAAPEKCDPAMKEQMTKFVGQTLAVLRVDSTGKLVDVKESRHGPASRFESELPFIVTLPPTGVRTGQAWDRTYVITLEPPQGTGERYNAVQKYVCLGATGTQLQIGLSTEIHNMPPAVADQVPLVQVQPEGEAVFDLASGRLQSARLRIEKEVKGHQGEGSRYQFKSVYTEEFAGNQ